MANVDPDIKLYGASFLVASEFHGLGLIFHKKLTFNMHVEYLKDRFMKALNLLCVVASSCSQRLGSGLCDFAQFVPFSCPFEIRLWLCCVWFSSSISPWVSWSCAECGVAYLSWSISPHLVGAQLCRFTYCCLEISQGKITSIHDIVLWHFATCTSVNCLTCVPFMT